MKYYGKLFGEERSGKRPCYWDTGKTGQDWEDIEKERDELRKQIRMTILENLHLADGDICTLKRLKDAIGFDLDSPENHLYPASEQMTTKQNGEPDELGCDALFGSSWKPIETAPNGLNPILITDGDSIWVDQKLGDDGDDVQGEYYFNGHDEWEAVTHWMAIPSLPNAEVRRGHAALPKSSDGL